MCASQCSLKTCAVRCRPLAARCCSGWKIDWNRTNKVSSNSRKRKSNWHKNWLHYKEVLLLFWWFLKFLHWEHCFFSVLLPHFDQESLGGQRQDVCSLTFCHLSTFVMLRLSAYIYVWVLHDGIFVVVLCIHWIFFKRLLVVFFVFF